MNMNHEHPLSVVKKSAHLIKIIMAEIFNTACREPSTDHIAANVLKILMINKDFKYCQLTFKYNIINQCNETVNQKSVYFQL
jgi:hypothetical protein